MKIPGKMGKPGPDAIFFGFFVKSWEAQKKFPAPVFYFTLEKIFKVYLRERSERKITLSTHA